MCDCLYFQKKYFSYIVVFKFYLWMKLAMEYQKKAYHKSIKKEVLRFNTFHLDQVIKLKTC